MAELRTDGRGRILVIIALGWFLSIGVRMIYPALLPYLRATYGLDLTTAGLLLTVLGTTFGIGQLPSGVLADRFGEGNVLVAGALVSAGTLVLVVTAGSTVILFAATALLGFGTALYGVPRISILADLFPDQVGTATGLTMAAGDAGNSMLPPLSVVIAATFAWQLGFGFIVPLFLLVAVGLWMIVPARTSGSTSAVDTISPGSVRYVFSELRQPSIVTGTSILVCGTCIWYAFTGFYPTYLIEVKGLSATVAGGLFGLFFVLGIGVKLLSGVAYDRIGIRRSLVVAMGIAGTALVLLPLVEGFWPLVAVTALVSTLLGYSTITTSFLSIALPDDMRGTGLGFVRTGYITISATSPLFFGAVADRGFFDEAFLGLAALAGGVVLLSIRIPDE